MLIRKGGEPEFLKGTDSTFVGAFDSVTYAMEKITLQPEDAIFMYTDGVTEAANWERKLFSEERLVRAVSAHSREPIRELAGKTLSEVESFIEKAPQSDDITILILKYFMSR